MAVYMLMDKFSKKLVQAKGLCALSTSRPKTDVRTTGDVLILNTVNARFTLGYEHPKISILSPLGLLFYPQSTGLITNTK